MKKILFKKLFYNGILPFNVLPSLASPRSIGFFHRLKQCWKFSFVRTFRNSADFRFTFSIDSNRVPFKADLIFENKKRSPDATSGEYDMYSSTGVPLVAK